MGWTMPNFDDIFGSFDLEKVIGGTLEEAIPAGIGYLFSGSAPERDIYGEVPVIGEAMRRLQSAGELQAAALDPTSPKARGLSDVISQEYMRNMLQSLQRSEMMSRRMSAMGYDGARSEREDEARSSAILRGGMEAKRLAAREAISRLMEAAQQERGAATSYTGMAQPFQQYGQLQAERGAGQAEFLKTLGEGIGTKIMGGFGPQVKGREYWERKAGMR